MKTSSQISNFPNRPLNQGWLLKPTSSPDNAAGDLLQYVSVSNKMQTTVDLSVHNRKTTVVNNLADLFMNEE